MTEQLTSVQIRQATEADAHLEAFDHTKLSALNTCPTWGVIRYGMHRTDKFSGRAMALEAGSACHEVFAAHRLWHLFRVQSQPLLADFHGIRLFGKTRYAEMRRVASDGDDRQRMMHFCLEALMTSGFYDDPRDNRRTLSNLEECCIAYIDRTDFTQRPIWIKHPENPQSLVGIEIPFDLVITWTFDSGRTLSVRFVGKLDGLHVHMAPTDDEKIIKIHENKTASRLDDAWIQSFAMSHQVTGYMAASSSFTNTNITQGVVHGLAVPLPKSYDYGGVIDENVSRSPVQFRQWLDWFYFTVTQYLSYKDDPVHAPKFTHSCNRYFRPCSMLPFCTADMEEKARILEDLQFEEWSPLHEKVTE